MKLIEREHYLNKLKDVIGTPDIKVITGVRRSGKSKLLEAFMVCVQDGDPSANIIHINFNMNAYESLTEYHALNDYIEKVQYSGKFLLQLINDVLDISKISQNKFQINKTF